jgi:hypothetical protein
LTSESQASGAVEPRNEAWWEDAKDSQDWMPADDVSLLGPYEKTRPGFEIVYGETNVFENLGDGYSRVCLWSIYEKNKDPAESDKEKQKINEMQGVIERLSDDDRYVRIQIACLHRCFWTFPANVDLVLDGIASGKVKLETGISCEPPWVRMRLILQRRRGPSAEQGKPAAARLHHQQGVDPLEDGRQKLIRAYATILACWAAEGRLDWLKAELPARAELAERIYRRLGEPTRPKWLYVQKLCWCLNWWGTPRLPWEGQRERTAEFGKAFDAAIQQALGGEEDRIGRLIDRNNDNGSCHHAFFRHVDHIIAHIGAGRPVTLPGAGQERKRIHGTITNYVHALGSWLAGRTPNEAVAIWPPCEQAQPRVYGALGDPDPRKRWLAACLWKKLQESDRQHGLGPLDRQPERFALPPNALTA